MDFFKILIELFVGYIALLILTKVLGKTQITQITAFDFISALVLGEFVGNALYDDKIGLSKIIFSIALWGVLIYTTELITQKFRRSRTWLEGGPSIVIHRGQIDYAALKKNHLDLNQLQHLLRSKDVFSIRECEFAILETDGTVSVIKKPMYASVTAQDLNLTTKPVHLAISLILDGDIVKDNLSLIKKDEEWLLSQCKMQGANEAKDVLYAEWKEGEPLFVQLH